MTQQGQAVFALVKNFLAKSSQLVIMNEEDLLILYTDASTRAVDGVLMYIQDGIEKPVIFLSHVLSDQCFRLLREDPSLVPKLVRWRVILSEYRFSHQAHPWSSKRREQWTYESLQMRYYEDFEE